MFPTLMTKIIANVFLAVGTSLILETMVCETIKMMIAKIKMTWRRPIEVFMIVDCSALHSGRMELDFWDDMMDTTLSDPYTKARLLWL